MRIGDMLVKVGLIDEMQLQSALAHQRQYGGRLGDVLINNGMVDEMMLYKGLARQMNVPLVSIPEALPARTIVAQVPTEVCRRHEIIAVASDDREVTVAMSDPSNMDAVDEVGFKTGKRVKVVLAPAREIEWAQRRFFGGEKTPCPPPKQRGATQEMSGMEIVHAGGDGSHRVPTNPHMAALPPDQTLHIGDPIATTMPPDQDPLDDVATTLEECTQLLRVLVDTCVSRGVFTREEYLDRVRKA
jgi:hypothetical protein